MGVERKKGKKGGLCIKEGGGMRGGNSLGCVIHLNIVLVSLVLVILTQHKTNLILEFSSCLNNGFTCAV